MCVKKSGQIKEICYYVSNFRFLSLIFNLKFISFQKIYIYILITEFRNKTKQETQMHEKILHFKHYTEFMTSEFYI